MNKKTLSSIVIGILASPVIAFALSSTTPPGPASIPDMPTLVSKIETFMWVVFGGIAVVCFVIAGILFLTAGGDPEKVGTARRAAMWGVAGVVVGILAYSILYIVGAAMGVQ